MNPTFRSEIVDHKSGSLLGNVVIWVPLSRHVIGYLIAGGVAGGAVFLSLASYARIEVVSGTIAPAAGLATIMPTRSGVIASLPVHEEQDVQAGAELASIRAEEDSASGTTAASRIQTAIALQDTNLAVQLTQTEAAAQAKLGQPAAQRDGLAAEVAQLQSQIQFQQDLVASAQRDVDRVRPVAASGFISTHDFQQREDALLSRRQSLAQLVQALAAKRSAVTEAEQNMAQVTSQSRAQRASLAASRAQVAQQAASAANSRSYVLRAPGAGRVTALTARVGQPANAQTAFMTILPAGSDLRSELVVPSTAIGFIKLGQEVRLPIDLPMPLRGSYLSGFRRRGRIRRQ
jgi:membrane fusion protein